jgi:hypothetical protein
MALRWSTATGGLLLTATLLGVGCTQGSGSYTHTGQPPPVAVLGAVETRSDESVSTAATATTTTAAGAPFAADTATVEPEPTRTEVRDGSESTGEATTASDDLEARTLARISYPWRTRLPGWEIVFLAARPSLRGVSFPADKRIEIYVRSTDTEESLARVVAHELGHATDVTLNDSFDRARWRAARGVAPTVPWWPDGAVTDFATMAGDFAEAFAAWQTGVTSLSTVAGQPTGDQLALLASLVS